jgi:hypothetical protein
MAQDGKRFLILTALIFLFSWASFSQGTEPEQDIGIGNTLAVQTALLQGTDLLKRFEYKEAVKVLESQLPRINGNRQYLTALRDAYRGYIEELRRASKEDEAKLYVRRLAILDGKSAPNSNSAEINTEGRVPANDSKNSSKGDNHHPIVKAEADSLPSAPEPIFRAKIDDPASLEKKRENPAKKLVADADVSFDKRQFAEAGRLYQMAYQSDQSILTGKEDRMAYCKLDHVVRQLNNPPPNGLALVALEQEVQQAVELAPKMERYGKDLLTRIHERRDGKNSETKTFDEGAPIAIRHIKPENGWDVAETANFRILHKGQSRETVEKAATIAEQSRSASLRKWFGEQEDKWQPACEIFLHATNQEYVHETNKPANSPGHSTVKLEGDRVISRRIDLHCDEPTMLAQRLPHETTHVVLAGKFGDKPLPRWADEGLAVMAEPREQIDRYLAKLQDCRKARQLFYFNKMLEMQDYPDARRIDAFYCESVSLVQFLIQQKDPYTLTKFLRDGQRNGFEAAARTQYGFNNLNELQQSWEKYAFGQTYTTSARSQR